MNTNPTVRQLPDRARAGRSWLDPSLGRGNDPFYLMAKLQGRAVKAALEMQLETLDFARRRLARDIDFIDDVVEARSPADALALASGFALEACGDYVRTMLRSLDFGARVADETASDLAGEVTDMARDAQAAIAHQASLAA